MCDYFFFFLLNYNNIVNCYISGAKQNSMLMNVLSCVQFKDSLFIRSPYGMIQCDMQLNINIYFYVNKTKRALLA